MVKGGHIFYTFICSSIRFSLFVIIFVLKEDNLEKGFGQRGVKRGHIFNTFICSSIGFSLFVIRFVLKRDNLGKGFGQKGGKG